MHKHGTYRSDTGRSRRVLRRSVREAIMDAIRGVGEPSATTGSWCDEDRGDFEGPWVDEVLRDEIEATLRHLRPFMRRRRPSREKRNELPSDGSK